MQSALASPMVLPKRPVRHDEQVAAPPMLYDPCVHSSHAEPCEVEPPPSWADPCFPAGHLVHIPMDVALVLLECLPVGQKVQSLMLRAPATLWKVPAGQPRQPGLRPYFPGGQGTAQVHSVCFWLGVNPAGHSVHLAALFDVDPSGPFEVALHGIPSHAVASSLVEYVPGAHGRHGPLTFLELPLGHAPLIIAQSDISVEPFSVVVLPGGHRLHSDAPV